MVAFCNGGPMKTISKPLRLSVDLVSEAETKCHYSKRSVPMQIEYWAHIGSVIDEFLTPKDVDALINGRAEVRIEPKISSPVDLSSVFDQLESDRASGKLHEKVVSSREWFEVSSDHPGYLVKVSSSGERTLGKFVDGEFRAVG